ncbi:MAG: hypothetical protein F4Y33_09340 [Gemmatimonadales bacterium]|nr:hypothetical protein [Gemmatimonadales bacterium]
MSKVGGSLLDHATNYVAGFAVGERADSELALSAWRVAERTVDRDRVEELVALLRAQAQSEYG